MKMRETSRGIDKKLYDNNKMGERIGIFATQTQLANWAVEQGLISQRSEWQNLSEAQKQAHTLEFVQQTYELSGAIGQAARESGEYANVTANLQAAWEKFLAVVGTPILEALLPILQGITDAIVWLSGAVGSAIEKYQAWAEAHPILSTALQTFAVILGAVVAALVLYQGVMAISATVTALFGGAIALLTSPITLVVVAIAGLIAAVVAVYQNWESIGPMLGQVWENIKTTVINLVTGMVNSVKDWFVNMWNKVKETTSGIVSTITTRFTNAVNTTKEKFQGMFNAVKEWFGKIPGWIKDKWGEAQSFLEGINLFNIGKNIITGLWNGLKDAWRAVYNWVSEKVDWIVNKFKWALNIHSPSRVFRDEIGEQIMAGLLIGLEDGWGSVKGFLSGASNWLASDSFAVPEINASYSSALATPSYTPPTRSKEVIMLEETNYLLRKLVDKDIDMYVDGVRVSEQINEPFNYINDLKDSRQRRIQGGLAR